MFTSAHVKNLTANLQAMRRNKTSTDVVIVCQGTQFHAHKIILTATSRYFRTMFSTDMKEASSGVVNLKNLSPDIVEEVLNFLYTSVLQKLPDDPLKVQDLFEAAHLFQVDEMVKQYVQQLCESVRQNNFEIAWELGHKYDVENLKFKVTDFLVENVVGEDCRGYPTVSLECIKKVQPVHILYFFEELKKKITSFTDLVEAVLNWVKHDRNNRKKYLEELMYLIGIRNQGFDVMKSLAKDELIRESGELMELFLIKALQ